MPMGRPRDDDVGGWRRGLVGVGVEEPNDDDNFDGDDDDEEVSPYNIDDQTDFYSQHRHRQWHHFSISLGV